MSTVAEVRTKYQRLSRVMDERSRRVWAATEAAAAGWGGVTLVARATGMARNTVAAGVRELKKRGRPMRVQRGRVRRRGGGRKRLVEHDPRVLKALDYLLAQTTRGDPQVALRWTCKSTQRLAEELGRMGYEVSDRSVASLLKKLGYRLQATQSGKEGAAPPDRTAQFEHINRQALAFQKRGGPVISVDASKQQLTGESSGVVQEGPLRGGSEMDWAHDRADVTGNEGWGSVEMDRDTVEFAIETTARWWRKMGCRSYPRANELLLVAHAGGTSHKRSRLWRPEIQRFADQTGLKVSICQLPPGTSKWRKIEQRIFSCITQKRYGRPRVCHQVVVNLIGNTTMRHGPKIKARIDNRNYDLGSDDVTREDRAPDAPPAPYQGDWNYTISPRAA
jgi:Rhodopirellula transposase DDE domain